MLFANFVERNIGLQNTLLAPQPFQHSLIVAIVARLLSTPYLIHCYPSGLSLQIKLLKHDTSVITFTNTTAPLHSHPFVLLRMMRSSMAVALGCGKLDTNFITVLAHFFLLMLSNQCMPNYIFMMQTT